MQVFIYWKFALHVSGCLTHASSGVNQTVIAASGTVHSVRATVGYSSGPELEHDHGQTGKLPWILLCKLAVNKTKYAFILLRSNEIQQYPCVYLLQIYSTCFGCLSHPSSGIHQTVTAASGTGHSVRATTFRQRGLYATLAEGCCSDTMTCTRSCSYSLMYSWWWVR